MKIVPRYTNLSRSKNHLRPNNENKWLGFVRSTMTTRTTKHLEITQNERGLTQDYDCNCFLIEPRSKISSRVRTYREMSGRANKRKNKTKKKKNKLTAKNIAREEQKHGCLHESKIISCRQVRALSPSLSLSLQVWRARSLHLPRNVAAERKVKTNTPDVPVLDEGSRRYPTKRCIVVGPTGFATSFGNPRSNLDRFLSLSDFPNIQRRYFYYFPLDTSYYWQVSDRGFCH